jgi:hypothetical protein
MIGYYLGRKNGEVIVYRFNYDTSEIVESSKFNTVIYKEVTLFFQIVQIMLVIPMSLNIQDAKRMGVYAAQGNSMMSTQINANHVQVRK